MKPYQNNEEKNDTIPFFSSTSCYYKLLIEYRYNLTMIIYDVLNSQMPSKIIFHYRRKKNF